MTLMRTVYWLFILNEIYLSIPELIISWPSRIPKSLSSELSCSLLTYFNDLNMLGAVKSPTMHWRCFISCRRPSEVFGDHLEWFPLADVVPLCYYFPMILTQAPVHVGKALFTIGSSHTDSLEYETVSKRHLLVTISLVLCFPWTLSP